MGGNGTVRSFHALMHVALIYSSHSTDIYIWTVDLPLIPFHGGPRAEINDFIVKGCGLDRGLNYEY